MTDTVKVMTDIVKVMMDDICQGHVHAQRNFQRAIVNIREERQCVLDVTNSYSQCSMVCVFWTFNSMFLHKMYKLHDSHHHNLMIVKTDLNRKILHQDAYTFQ